MTFYHSHIPTFAKNKLVCNMRTYNPQNEKMRVSETKGLKNPQIPKTKRLLFIQTHKRQRNPKTTRFPASCFIHSIQTEHHLYRKSN